MAKRPLMALYRASEALLGQRFMQRWGKHTFLNQLVMMYLRPSTI